METNVLFFPRQTLHFKLLNQLSAVATQLNMSVEHECSAYNFHSDLFLSGLERIIMVSRPSTCPTRPSAPAAPPTPPVPICHPFFVSSFETDQRDARAFYSNLLIFRPDEEPQLCTIRLCILRSRGMYRMQGWRGTKSRGRSRGSLAPPHLRCVSLAYRAHHRPRRASRRGRGGTRRTYCHR